PGSEPRMTLTRIAVTAALAVALTASPAAALADALPQASGTEDAVVTYSGTATNQSDTGSATGTVELTRENASIVMPYEGSELVTCSPTLSSQYNPGTVTVTASLTSGDPCHIFDECPQQEPE